MEGRAVPAGELLQGQQAHVVEHVRAGQERCLPAALALAGPGGAAGAAAQGQRREADGALGGVPVQGLQQRDVGLSCGSGFGLELSENGTPRDGDLNTDKFHPALTLHRVRINYIHIPCSSCEKCKGIVTRAW